MFTHLSDSYHILSDIIPASRRRLEHFQVVAHHLPEADMYDIVVRQLSLWVSGMLSFSLLCPPYLITIFLPLLIYSPFLLGLPLRRTPSSVYHASLSKVISPVLVLMVPMPVVSPLLPTRRTVML